MLTNDWLRSLVDPVSAIAQEAGDTILAHDPATVEKTLKADNSPVTQADLAANEIIIRGLRELTPNIPILSEETTDRADNPTLLTTPDSAPPEPEWFWCVDPLDGTKGFLKKLGEYSVNIALIHRGDPVLGIMRVPAFLLTYQSIVTAYGVLLSQYQHDHDHASPINLLTQPSVARQKPWKVASSGAEISSAMQKLLDHHGIAKRYHAHSALKFGWVMSGKVDLLLRVHPTCSWDTAAGQVLLRSTGGDIVNYQQEPLRYRFNGPSWINPSFIAVAHMDMLADIDFALLPHEHGHRTHDQL